MCRVVTVSRAQDEPNPFPGKHSPPPAQSIGHDTGSRHFGDSFLGLLTSVLTGKLSIPSAGNCRSSACTSSGAVALSSQRS